VPFLYTIIIDVTVTIPSAFVWRKIDESFILFFWLFKKQSFAIWAERMILDLG
jgi:hypothetical protein